MNTRLFDDSDLSALLDSDYAPNLPILTHASQEHKHLPSAPVHVPQAAPIAVRTSFDRSPPIFFGRQQAMDTRVDAQADKKKEEKTKTISRRQRAFLHELHFIINGIKHLSINDSADAATETLATPAAGLQPMHLSRQRTS